MENWEILLTEEVEQFLDALYESDQASHRLVNEAILILERVGPPLGRPLVDTLSGTKLANLKELRPGSTRQTEIRILFAFDPWRAAVLLVAGDKAVRWKRWYAEAIPQAEKLYHEYLTDRQKEVDR